MRMLLTALLFLCASWISRAAGELTLVKEIPLSTAGLPDSEPVPRLVPGDVNGDGKLDWVITSGCKVVRVYDHDGAMLWEKVNPNGIYDPTFQKPYYSAVWDLDGDGKCEVIGFQQKGNDIRSTPWLTIFDGQTGAIKKETELFFKASQPGNHLHRGFVVIAYMRSKTEPDIIVSGDDNCTIIHAYDKNLKPLWQKEFAGYDKPKFWNDGGGHYMWTCDLNGDGLDELCDGRYIFTGNGQLVCTLDCGEHADGLVFGDFDPARKGLEVAACGAKGVVCFNINPETFAPTRLWTVGNKVIPHSQWLVAGEFDKANPGPELMIQGKGKPKDATFLIDARTGRVLRHVQNVKTYVAGIMDYDGDRSEDEIVCWQGTVIDKAGKTLSGTSWYSPKATWESWNMAVLAMDVLGDGRDEIVALSRDRLCIGQNTAKLDNPPPSFRGQRDYMLRFTNCAFSRGCLGFDYRRQPEHPAAAAR